MCIPLILKNLLVLETQNYGLWKTSSEKYDSRPTLISLQYRIHHLKYRFSLNNLDWLISTIQPQRWKAYSQEHFTWVIMDFSSSHEKT